MLFHVDLFHKEYREIERNWELPDISNLIESKDWRMREGSNSPSTQPGEKTKESKSEWEATLRKRATVGKEKVMRSDIESGRESSPGVWTTTRRHTPRHPFKRSKAAASLRLWLLNL